MLLHRRARREALIPSSPGGAELKSYTALGMAILLVFLVPAYGRLASRVDRLRLISWVTVFFIACLAGFFVLGRAHTPYLGIAFFLWVGIFNLMIVAQFWSFANDVYTQEQGKRLFAIVAFGSSLGAIVGAWIAKPLIGVFGPFPPLLIGAGMLALSILLTRIVNARERAAHDVGGRVIPEAKPLGPEGGFKLVMSQRYLLLIALLMVIVNLVNTNGEYILGKTLSSAAERMVAAGQTGGLSGDDSRASSSAIVCGYHMGEHPQRVSSAVRRFTRDEVSGVWMALFALPVIALGG